MASPASYTNPSRRQPKFCQGQRAKSCLSPVVRHSSRGLYVVTTSALSGSIRHEQSGFSLSAQFCPGFFDEFTDAIVYCATHQIAHVKEGGLAVSLPQIHLYPALIWVSVSEAASVEWWWVEAGAEGRVWNGQW